MTLATIKCFFANRAATRDRRAKIIRQPTAFPVAVWGFILGVTLAFPVAAHAATDQKALSASRFTLAQIFDLERAVDPQISPDGTRVAFVRASFDRMQDKTQRSLWIVNSDGSGLRPLTGPNVNASSPRWSPGGQRLLYVATSKGQVAEIRVRWMQTGQTARLASLQHRPGELAWSPDGTRMAFAMFVPAKQPQTIAHMPPKPKGADWGPPIQTITRLVYRSGGRSRPYGHTHLFVLPATGGTPRQVTSGDRDDSGSLTWTPDGKSLVYSANRHKNATYQPRNSDIYIVSAAGGKPRALTDRNGPDTAPAVSPDGTKIAYTGFNDRYQGYQVHRLYVMNRDGSDKRLVTGHFDRDVRHPLWSRNVKGLYIQYDDQGTTKIGYVTLAGKVTTLAANVGGVELGRPKASGSYSLAPAVDRFAFTLTAPDHPADVAVGRRSGAKAKRLTHLNQDLFGHEKLGTLEEIHFPSSFDSRRIDGWILKPPGFHASHKYPMILEIHGGPFLNYGPRFSAEDQLYAAAGYVVLYINPRGSTSYGEKFGNLINHDYPDHDYNDLMSGVDAVLKRGYVDPNSLYVTGSSGGGILIAWIVGHTDRFRAAVAAKPIINWYSWVLTTDIPEIGVKYWFPGFPWNHRHNYIKRSPITYAGHVTTPTMLITGGADYIAPSEEAVQFYRALKLRKVPTVLVRIPDAPHRIEAKPSNLMAKVAYILGWFDRYKAKGAER
jgi:acylaminoacyl-peptidase